MAEMIISGPASRRPGMTLDGRNCKLGSMPDSSRLTWAALAVSRGGMSFRRSDLSLLGDLESVIHLDTEVPDRGFQLGVPKQQLHGS